MKKTLLATFAFICVLLNPAIAQQYQWAKSAGGLGIDEINKVKLDNNSNIIASCASEGNITINSNTYPDKASYLIKYDTTGNVSWEMQCGRYNQYVFPNFSGYTYNAFDIDADDNIFMTGFFVYNGMLDTIALSSPDSNNVFLARADANGNILWHRNIAVNVYPTDVKLDAQKNIFICGALSDTAQFDSTTFINLGQPYTPDAFLAKYDSLGNLLWVKRAGSATGQGEEFNTMSFDNSGNIFLCGGFAGTMMLDTVQLIHPAGNNLYGLVAKYDSQGNAIWAKRCGYQAHRILTDAAGDAYSCGYFVSNPMEFDTATVGAYNHNGLFIAKINTNGTYQWIKIANPNFSTAPNSFAHDMTFNSNGNLLCYGIYTDTLSIDNFSFISNVPFNGSTFMLELSSTTGQVVGANSSSNTLATIQGLTIDSRNCIVAVGGRFRNTPPPVILGSDSLNENGGNDFYVARIGNCSLTSMEETIFLNSLQIFPNPFTDVIKIINKNSTFEKSHLKIHDSFGRIVFANELTSMETTVHLQNLPSGIYFLCVINGSDFFSTKLIKQ